MKLGRRAKLGVYDRPDTGATPPTMTKKRAKPLRKTGLPPGSLLHVGEIKTARPSISLIEFDAEGLAERSFASLEESRGYTPAREKLWLNVYGLQDPAILGEIGRRFGLHPLVQEDILNTHQRSKIEEYDRSEEHTSELQSPLNLVCRLLLEKKKKKKQI